jgi:hypothetical protein
MPAALARFPEIKTTSGGVDDPEATVALILRRGFHAQILSPRGSVWSRTWGNTNLHAVWRPRYGVGFRLTSGGLARLSRSRTPRAGGNLRTYRLACAATAEYVQYFGGTVSGGLAAVVTAINRVSGVYESELGIRLVLVADNDRLIYTNSGAQPYSNNPGLADAE